MRLFTAVYNGFIAALLITLLCVRSVRICMVIPMGRLFLITLAIAGAGMYALLRLKKGRINEAVLSTVNLCLSTLLLFLVYRFVYGHELLKKTGFAFRLATHNRQITDQTVNALIAYLLCAGLLIIWLYVLNIQPARKKMCVFFLVLLLAVAGDRLFHWSDLLTDRNSYLMLRDYASDHFLQALLLYLLFTVIGCTLLALPGVTAAIPAGILFGPVWGSVLCLTGATLAAVASFFAARFFLRESFRPVLEKNKLLKRVLFSGNRKHDLLVLMITRLVPVFPFNLQNFAYGLTAIHPAVYAAGTFVFMIPGVVLITIGSYGLTAENNRAAYLIVAAVLLAVVLLAGFIIWRVFMKDETKQREAIIVLTRVPEAGSVKTRLQPFLTPEQCAAFQEAMLKDTVRICNQAADMRAHCDVFVCHTPGDEKSAETLKRMLNHASAGYFAQGEGTLGERMLQAFEAVFRKGYDRAVLTGSDLPALTAGVLAASLDLLAEEGTDAVLNPADDGGYWLIGLKQAHPEAFFVQAYGTDTVFEETKTSMEQAGLRVKTGTMLADADTPDDLKELMKELRRADIQDLHEAEREDSCTVRFLRQLMRDDV
ncbi:MAG: TIGR04282 family arsenosugar biosynthesis glycosyltransferase [Lachnospiraceae bacterium]|nr:TIGR04282 family arsenosugar biosynthesis glycosyltransferase [Lachnospiraceae bacterium]